MSSVSDLGVTSLPSLSFISFNEKEAFKDIEELAFLSYYKEFKLLFCSSCFSAIFPSTSVFKSHLLGDLKLIPLELRTSIISQALEIFEKLEVVSFKESLDLIKAFSNSNYLPAFKELKVIDLYICNSCFKILSSKTTIKRHCLKDHKDSEINPIYKVIKGQGLEAFRFFFEINNNLDFNHRSRSLEPSSSIRDNSLLPNISSKEAFLASINNKEEELKEELSSFSINPNDILTPFQKRSRYPEYISFKTNKVLVELVAPIKKDELILNVLIINLKELLYLSLEKSTFLNKVYLNILNSFENNKIRNKPFSPLLRAKTRVNYFNFFSLFLSFFFRALSKALNKEASPFFKVSSSTLSLFNNLIDLVSNKLEEEGDYILELGNKSLKSKKKVFNQKVNLVKLTNIINRQEDSEDNSSESTSSLNSLGSSSSFSSSSTSNSSIKISLLSNSNIDTLKEIEKINSSKDFFALEVKGLLLKLLINLLKQVTDLNIFDSPINCFFAAISIRSSNLSLRTELELSQDYSKFIYCFQVLIIEYAFSLLFQDNTLELTTILRDFQDNFLNNSRSTGLSEVLNNRSYCFRVNKETSTLSFVSISNTKKDTILYKSISLSVDNLRTLFNNLINTSTLFLKETLLFSIPKSRYQEITLEKYSKFEDRSLTTPFYSFNNLSVNYKETSIFLREEVFNNPGLFSRFFSTTSPDLKLNLSAVKEYFNSILIFKKRLLLLIYLTSGLPLRGTELVTLRFLNSLKDQREIFLDIGSNLFIVNISYYKSQGNSERRAANIRYLPPRVSYLVLLYIVLVYPFTEFLNISTISNSRLLKAKSFIPYLFYFNNRLLDSRDLSLGLNSLSKQVLGQKLGIQIYRQVIITIIREFMLEPLDSLSLLLENDQDNSLKELVALQSNHSSKVEDLNYGRQVFTFKNINSNLQFKYLAFCLRFFTYFKINSIGSQVKSYISSVEIKNIESRERSLNEINRLAVRFSRVDSLNEDILAFNSKKHKRQVSSISSSITPYPKRLRSSDLLSLSNIGDTSLLLSNILKEFLNNKDAEFRSLEQELLIKSILLKVPYILAVLPTSIGKSLSYLLTSSLSTSKYTIIILPLVGLKLDILRRAREFNIPCYDYEEEKLFTTITLISIETIVSNSFISLVQGLINNNSLDRIIFDECHLLISASSYRSIMFRFKEILALPTQFVFLSGTLPLIFEDFIKTDLSLNSLSIIRSNCSRSNISYKASAYISNNKEKQLEEITLFISNFQSKEFLTKEDKILIFCSSEEEVELVSTYLNCSFFYSSLSKEIKEEIINNFVSSFEDYYSILVSTSSLQEGFDYSFIRLVIYKDIAYSFLGFLQGSSRGGRDNRPSTSIFFYNSNNTRLSNSLNILSSSHSLPLSRSKILEDDKALVFNYLNESICRRRVINLYLNSELIDECFNLNNKCDLCLSRTDITNKQVSRILSITKEVEVKREDIRSYISINGLLCIYCRLLSAYIPNSEFTLDFHTLKACPFNTRVISRNFKLWLDKKYLILHDNTCCFKCFLPTIICYSLKESESSTCFNLELITGGLDMLFIFRKELNLLNKYNLEDPRESPLTFTKAFFQKTFLEDIRTEGLLIHRALLLEE